MIQSILNSKVYTMGYCEMSYDYHEAYSRKMIIRIKIRSLYMHQFYKKFKSIEDA